MDDVRATIRVRGRVQGVFFRASARHEALRLSLSGWVRNERDGSVSALVEGSPTRVDDFIRWCRRGPPAARVDDVSVEQSAATGELDGFAVTG